MVDNVAFHKGAGVKEAIKKMGIEQALIVLDGFHVLLIMMQDLLHRLVLLL